MNLNLQVMFENLIYLHILIIRQDYQLNLFCFSQQIHKYPIVKTFYFKFSTNIPFYLHIYVSYSSKESTLP
jgi:hypothetical protein